MTYEVIATGSKGNCVVLENQIAVDMGVPYKKIEPYAKRLKLVLLTHQHGDHFNKATLRRLAEERPTLRFACCSWLGPLLVMAGVPLGQIDILQPGEAYDYKLFSVKPFLVKHDVPNCGWKIIFPNGKIFYCTDMNNLDGITAKNYDLYMVEANYEDKEIQDRIANKKVDGKYVYERKVLQNHMSEKKAIDWLYSNMGQQSKYVLLHGHQQ